MGTWSGLVRKLTTAPEASAQAPATFGCRLCCAAGLVDGVPASLAAPVGVSVGVEVLVLESSEQPVSTRTTEATASARRMTAP